MDYRSFYIPDMFNSGSDKSLLSDSLSVQKNTMPAKNGRTYHILNIYNPANQTKKELISNFVVRLNEYNEILQALVDNKRDSSTRHYIIQGQRGSGKTTLLLRLYYEVKDEHLFSFATEVPNSPIWDGHTASDIERLLSL